MKNRPSLLAFGCAALCLTAWAGPGDIVFSDAKIVAPPLFIAPPGSTSQVAATSPSFGFDRGPAFFLDAFPDVRVKMAAPLGGQNAGSLSRQGPDRMGIIRPDPNVDYKLIVKDPGFHLDDGIFDGQPDLRPAK
jgi:hypothetical protein